MDAPRVSRLRENTSVSKPKLALVMTTIGEGALLEDYCRQAEAEGWRDSLRLIVIPDKKTPPELYRRSKDLAQVGFDIHCPALDNQEAFLARLGGIERLIPYNTDNRRNVGYLMALEWGAEGVISLDDDNYCIPGSSLFDEYAVVCAGEQTLPAVHSADGWYNICELIKFEPNYRVYPRGYPYAHRHKDAEVERRGETGLVRLNAGLWLEHPDCDGITWLAAPVRGVDWNRQSILLGQTTWTPINTQNTSLHRDVVASYYFVRMGYKLAGLPIDRYGDIFSGYFAQACVRHMGHRIRVGTPVARHDRNTHNYLKDATNELACIWVLEDLLPWLVELKLEGSSYAETYLCLADMLEDQVERFSGFIWTDATRGYLHSMAYCMRQWIAACNTIG